jgi:hypothetical protein
MPLVDAAAVLAYAGVKTPSQAETDWAALCAAAVDEGITIRLNGAVLADPAPSELTLVATMAAGEAYKRKETPFGQTGFSDTENAVRFARDYLDGVRPQIDRYGNGPGIG